MIKLKKNIYSNWQIIKTCYKKVKSKLDAMRGESEEETSIKMQ